MSYILVMGMLKILRSFVNRDKCYNLLLKDDNSLPLKLNHDLVYDNGNTVIDSKSFKNFFFMFY